MKLHKSAWIFAVLFFPYFLCGVDLLNRSQFQIGGTLTYLQREKSGGSKQYGVPGGLRFSFDRLKRYGWYIGVEGEALWGTLKGHNQADTTLRSHFRSFWGEGRLGYTFQMKSGTQASITPYIGGGFLEENNDFVDPSPLKIRFRTAAPYVAFGALAWMNLCCGFEAGLNIKCRLPIDPKCTTSNDPFHAMSRQIIGERVQYLIELPITYRLNESGSCGITFSPFWSSRIYGGRINYPFDYLKTRLEFAGASVLLMFRF